MHAKARAAGNQGKRNIQMNSMRIDRKWLTRLRFVLVSPSR